MTYQIPEHRKVQIRSMLLENPMTSEEMSSELCMTTASVMQYISCLRKEYKLPAIHAWRGGRAVYIWERKKDAKRIKVDRKKRNSGHEPGVHANRRVIAIPPRDELQVWLMAARDEGRLAA